MVDRKVFDVFNMEDDLMIFLERIETWFKKHKVEYEDDKVVELLNALSKDVYALVRNACKPTVRVPDTLKFTDLVKLLQSQFVSIAVPFKVRRKYYECEQQPGVTVLDFCNRLFALSTTCEFGANRKEILRDRFICGLTKGPIFDKICELDLTCTIEKCVQVAQAKEATLPEAGNFHKIQGRFSQPSKAAVFSSCGMTNQLFEL